jgi:hypothetical protein
VVTAGPTASLSPARVAERDALAGYHGMWEDWIAMAATGDYQNPRLSQHTSGRALSLIYRGVYANRRDGVVAKGRPVLTPHVTATSPPDNPDRITVLDCADTTNWLNYRPNGQLEDNIPGGRRRVQALVLKKGGVWKVDVLVVQPVGTC